LEWEKKLEEGKIFPILPLKKREISAILSPSKHRWRKLNMTITKDTIIGDILTIAPQTAPLFMGIGMHCLGCPASRGETVEEACMVHGVEVDDLLAKVNEMIAAGE
jgi:hybrid cluster-associated redox disulfide protein